MPKQLPKSKPDYSLRRRFFSEIGTPQEWKDYGQGKLIDLETVQKQIKMLASTSRKVEIEFIHNNKLCGYNGTETGTTIIYDKK